MIKTLSAFMVSLPVAENEMLVSDSLNSYASRSALMGDIDGDNDIDTADVRACFAFVNNSENATELQRLAADCNSDGVITSADQQLLLSAINSGTTAF